MIAVRRMGHATFPTPDIARMTEYYTAVLGLQVVDRTAREAWLACPGDRHSVVLREAGEAACPGLTLQVAEDADLDELRAQLDAAGVTHRTATDSGPDLPEVVSVTDPSGLAVDLIRLRSAAPRPAVPGIVPRKLGHTAFFAADVQKTVDFYTQVLGFRVSDWIGDFFVFLRCSPDHHTVNFLRGPGSAMHHIAFELNDWSHVKTACDWLDKVGYPLSWGPGRHGPGHNIYTYHDNPDGVMVELFTELDQMTDEAAGCFDARSWHKDLPQRPKVWTPGTPTTNFWGVPRPVGINERPH
jgi:catechol 2,3-dioxygenase-like lactoylglutathione lyase family enzyme